MKKRMISLFMVACLMLTLAPVVLAASSTNARPAPDEGTLPEVTIENTITPEIASASLLSEGNDDPGYTGAGTQSNPYRITSEQGFATIASMFVSTTLRYTYIEIMNDLDLTQIGSPDDWMGYFMYFWGEIKGAGGSNGGEPVTISGMAADTYLIYGWYGGRVENLEFDMKGNAATINYICGRLNGEYRACTMEDITITSSTGPISLGSDAQANYAPFTYSVYGPFSMINCTNNADISGNTYAGVFVGYYPLDPNTGKFTFTNCVNNGEINLKHAGMFFGNNTGFLGAAGIAYAFNENNPSESKIVFSNCKNDGTIAGTDSANLFAGRPGGMNDSISDNYETYLRNNGGMGDGDIICIDNDLTMSLTYNINGTMALEKDSGNTVDYYVVSVYTYVNVYGKEQNNPDAVYVNFGTDRYGVSETIPASVENPGVTVKYYGVCDYPNGTPGLTLDESTGVPIATYSGQNYYWINHDMPYSSAEGYDFFYFVDEPGSSAIKVVPDIATLSAYSSNGTLLGIVNAIEEN